jgi:hypothetical protein
MRVGDVHRLVGGRRRSGRGRSGRGGGGRGGSGRRVWVWNGVGDGEGQVALSVGAVNGLSLVGLEGFQLVGLVIEFYESIAAGSAVTGKGDVGSLGLGSFEDFQELVISNGEREVGHEQGGLGRNLFARRTLDTLSRSLIRRGVGVAGGSVSTTFVVLSGFAVARLTRTFIATPGVVVSRSVTRGVAPGIIGGATASVVWGTSSAFCRAITILASLFG